MLEQMPGDVNFFFSIVHAFAVFSINKIIKLDKFKEIICFNQDEYKLIIIFFNKLN